MSDRLTAHIFFYPIGFFCSNVALFAYLNNYVGECNVIITNRNSSQKYENKTCVIIEPELSFNIMLQILCFNKAGLPVGQSGQMLVS